MTYEKPKCEYKDCEKDYEVHQRIIAMGEETEYHWYCDKHYAIIQASKDSGLPPETFESMEDNEDKK
jgi:hypothetical protein